MRKLKIYLEQYILQLDNYIMQKNIIDDKHKNYNQIKSSVEIL